MEGSGCTSQSHREYFRLVRERINDLAQLIAAAPCTYTLNGAVLAVRELEKECSRILSMEQIAAEHEREKEEKVRRAFGLS